MSDWYFGQEGPSLSMVGVVEQIVPVTLGERSYDIVLHSGLLATLGTDSTLLRLLRRSGL